jgi:hypothetical protein
MVEVNLTPYSEDLRHAWDAVVQSAKNGNFLHLRDYMGYHAHRFDEQSVIVSDKGRPIAVLPCNRVHDRLISHGGLTYGGLIYGNDLRAVDVLAIFERLVEYYQALGCRSLSYKAIPHIYHSYPAEEDLYALYRLDARLTRRDLSTVIQMPNRIRLSELRRRATRKAIKHGLLIRDGDFFLGFHDLLANALRKFDQTPVHSAGELRLLHSRFPDRIRLFGAFRGDELLAGALIYDFGHVVHSQYLASSDEGKALGALDAVIAHLLDVVCSQRQFFSFGISTEQEGRYLNEGLVFQKEGFGGRSIVHDCYELGL